LPALQVLIGGGVLGSGDGKMADKVIKVPSKRGPDVLRTLLADYKSNQVDDENYLQYSKRLGEKYFYDLLKPLASLDAIADEDYIDWGQQEKFATAIGVGECAGVMIDLVATLIMEAEEKLECAKDCIEKKSFADGIYNAYSAFVHAAKALLLQQGIQCNTQAGILKDFDQHFTTAGLYTDSKSFREKVLQINEAAPSEEFAISYKNQAKEFVEFARQYREQAVKANKVA